MLLLYRPIVMNILRLDIDFLDLVQPRFWQYDPKTRQKVLNDEDLDHDFCQIVDGVKWVSEGLTFALDELLIY